MTGILASASLAAEVRGNKREDGENRSHEKIVYTSDNKILK